MLFQTNTVLLILRNILIHCLFRHPNRPLTSRINLYRWHHWLDILAQFPGRGRIVTLLYYPLQDGELYMNEPVARLQHFRSLSLS